MTPDSNSGAGASSPESSAQNGGGAQAKPRQGSFRETQPGRRKVPEDGRVIFHDEVEILPDKRLPQFDQGPVKAYAARARNERSKEDFFALVCEPNLVPRTRQAPSFAGIINPSLIHVLASGIVHWPAASEERYVLLYENKLGQPLMTSMRDPGLGWKYDQILKAFIKPMVNVLLDLRDVDIVHGAIRPTNIFDGGSRFAERVILGDCLATPASFTQPVLFETIERAMADSLARGYGTVTDDLYAFGVTLALLMRTRGPMAEMSDEDILRHKMETGTYAMLTEGERFTGPVVELLRGLLYDDGAQRWTLEDVSSWLEGQHQNPRQAVRKPKAARPVHFNNDRYFRPALLAMDLDKNSAEGAQLVETGSLEQWIQRSLEDKATGARYEQALESVSEYGRGPGYWDRLLCRVSIALDPEGPIRYRGLKMHPEGIPAALVDAFVKKKDLQPFVDIINQQTAMFWLTVQDNVMLDIGALVSRYDNCRAFLRQTTMGYGIERCLYFLSPECQCLSERLKGYYVRNPEDMMYAFEDMAGKSSRPDLFVDRHIAAFLSVKDRRVIDPFFMELNAPEYHRRIMGNLKVLASIQQRSRMEPFPGIAGWIADSLEPVYERYHDRELRVKMKEKMEKTKAAGDLSKMAAILENNETRQLDFENFKKAMREYAELREELRELEQKLGEPETFGREIGQEYAAIASSIIAGVIILATAFVFFSGKGGL